MTKRQYFSQVVIAGFMVVAVSDANAYSYANALIDFDNFAFTKVSGAGTFAITGQPPLQGSASCDSPVSGTLTGGPAADPLRQNCDNVSGANNAFTSVGVTNGNYGWGDAQVYASPTITTSTPASLTGLGRANMAEAFQPLWFSTDGIANGGASQGTRTLAFSIGTGGATLRIAFDARPYVDAFVSGITDGSYASGQIDFGVKIQKSGATSLEWKPGNSTPTPGSGASSISEVSAFSLNSTLFADPLTGNPATYDPCLLGAPNGHLLGSVAPVTCGVGNHFQLTFALVQGSYTWTQTSDAQASALNNIPEPNPLALLGCGFMVLGARRFRRMN
jgi:hypothetical protein